MSFGMKVFRADITQIMRQQSIDIETYIFAETKEHDVQTWPALPQDFRNAEGRRRHVAQKNTFGAEMTFDMMVPEGELEQSKHAAMQLAPRRLGAETTESKLDCRPLLKQNNQTAISWGRESISSRGGSQHARVRGRIGTEQKGSHVACL